MKLSTPLYLLVSAMSVTAADYNQIVKRALLPRQTSTSEGGGLPGALGIDGECLDDAIEFLSTMPTPSPEFLKAMEEPTEEGCYELPESLDSEFSSYSSAVQTFLQENAEFVSQAEEACADATIIPDSDFCEGKGPDDRDGGSGLRVSMGILVGSVAIALLAL